MRQTLENLPRDSRRLQDQSRRPHSGGCIHARPHADAIALLDRGNGLLFTGDTYYPGPIWLFRPETDFDAYVDSVKRLAALSPELNSCWARTTFRLRNRMCFRNS